MPGKVVSLGIPSLILQDSRGQVSPALGGAQVPRGEDLQSLTHVNVRTWNEE